MNTPNTENTMNTMNTENESKESNILKLESLVQEYNLLLIEYQQIYQSYLNSVSQSAGNTKDLVTIPNTVFWGTDGLSESSVSNIDECKNLCVANSSCSGATFDPKNNYCWIRSGEGSIIPSKTNEITIIPKTTEYVMVLKTLHLKMESINEEILKMFQKSVFTDLETTNQIASNLLRKNYKKLLKNRKMIDEKIAENNELTQEIKDTSMYVTHKYLFYLVFFLLFLFFIYLFFRMFFSNDTSRSTTTSTNVKENNFMFGGGGFRNSIHSFRKYLRGLFNK